MDKVITNTVFVMVTIFLSKIFGFFREIVLASKYGASSISDAFIIAHGMPTILLMGIAGALATSYIPTYTKLAAENLGKAKKMSYNLVTILIVAGMGLTVLFITFSKPLVQLFAVGFTGETLELTVSLAKVTMWTLVPILLINLLGAYLRMNGKFLLSSSFGIVVNLFVIATILLSSSTHTQIMAWGMCLGFYASAGLVALQSYRLGFQYRPTLQWNTTMQEILRLCFPIFLSSTVLQVSKIIDRSFASMLSAGSVSAMNYASKLQEFIIAVFVNSLGMVIFPELSKLESTDDIGTLKKYAIEAINLMGFMIIPIMAGAMILSKPIVTILFMRGAFDDAAVAMTSESLWFYAIGFLAIGFNMVLTRVFYALRDTKTPAKNSILSVSLNILLNYLLVSSMAHKGLALATSLSGILTTILLLISLRKKIGPLGLRASLRELIKVLIATAVMSLSVVCLNHWMQLRLTPDSFLTHGVVLLTCASMGAIVYYFMTLLLNVRQARALFNFLVSKAGLA